MRYRPLDPNGDYTVGVPFLANSPACVAQAILTRLKLWQGEWFLDTSDGTPWRQKILGKHANVNPDAVLKRRILGTPGVDSIAKYSSSLNPTNRAFSMTCTVNTIYGPATINVPVLLIPKALPNIVLSGTGIILQTDSGINITVDS